MGYISSFYNLVLISSFLFCFSIRRYMHWYLTKFGLQTHFRERRSQYDFFIPKGSNLRLFPKNREISIIPPQLMSMKYLVKSKRFYLPLVLSHLCIVTFGLSEERKCLEEENKEIVRIRRSKDASQTRRKR